MRPVNRGDHPIDNNAEDIQYKKYQDARGQLIRRLGEYCSYCEVHLDTSLAVEHVRPKKPEGASENIAARELDWHNFLLACTNCNSTKGNIDVELGDYFWPDQDNTFLALSYSEGGLISPADNLSQELKIKAEKTISLTGLDKTPNTQSASDRRWLNRKESWQIAQRSKRRLAQNDNEYMREQIIETAYCNGFWSVWMKVFHEDSDMLRRLIEAFPGTADDCFDENNNYSSCQRQKGQL